MGRLFDAVAALIGVRQHVSYEGQAAIELESLCGDRAREYPAGILDPAPLLHAILDDLRRGVPREEIALGFHVAVSNWVAAIAQQARECSGINRIGLTGGVFQNITLLRLSVERLRSADFEVLVHRIVPANDGGLSLGQARLAMQRNPM
jgi:hydrogenase maturation protein HypF